MKTTSSNYEIKMSTMSDHLIEITEKMAKQQDEIERLVEQLNMQNSNILNGKNSKTKKFK